MPPEALQPTVLARASSTVNLDSKVPTFIKLVAFGAGALLLWRGLRRMQRL